MECILRIHECKLVQRSKMRNTCGQVVALLVVCLFILLLYLYFVGRNDTGSVKSKPYKELFLKNLNPVLLADERKENSLQNDLSPMLTNIKPISTMLSQSEEIKMKECITNSNRDFRQGHGKFWSGNTQYIRHKHHKYLTNQSFVLDVGGNVGEDAAAILNAYKPKHYVILEPLESHYQKLVKKFKNDKEVFVYKIGLAKENAEFMVKVTGHDGDATSIFKKERGGNVPLKVINATNFFIKLGLGFYDIDLITVNCEGCEFDVLEAITSSSLVNHFKHIQFATHISLPGLKNPVSRYCKIQRLLSRTHSLTYQFKFTWESWKRIDLPQ